MSRVANLAQFFSTLLEPALRMREGIDLPLKREDEQSPRWSEVAGLQ
jgi:hypothetical protein